MQLVRQGAGVLRFVIIVSFLTHLSKAVCSQNRIVGLFKPLSYQDRAVQLAHSNNTVLVCYEPLNTSSTTVSWQDICRLISGGVLAFISDQPLPTTVNDVISAAQIPVVSTAVITTNTNSTVVSIAPSEEQLANALSQLILFNSWTSVVLITWQGSGLDLFMPGPSTGYRVDVVYYIDSNDDVMRSKLIKIKQSAFFVIILHHYNLVQVLHIFEMATEERLNIFPYVWILSGSSAEMLTAQVSQSVVLQHVPRLLAVYPVISKNPSFKEFANAWKSYGSVKQLQSAAYVYDAFKILHHSIAVVTTANPNFTQIQQSCDTLVEWQFSTSFQATINTIMAESTIQRLTLSDPVYHYFSIDQFGFNKIATWPVKESEFMPVSSIRWCSEQELSNLPLCYMKSTLRCNTKIPPPRAPEDSAFDYDYSRYSFDVVTIQSEPFVDVTQDDSGNEVYAGLCVDLLNALSDKMGFHYTLRLVADGQYGGVENGRWTGLVGDLVRRNAEIALAPLTITSNREAVIDFTKGYYDIGLRILYNARKNGNKFTISTLFQFLEPFESRLWGLIVAAIIVVSILTALFGRMSPYDWHQDPPDDFTLWESRLQMTLYNTLWQTVSAVLQQGAETAPRSTSSRILIGGWWFVCLVLAAAFTANLAAIFATDEAKSVFDSIEELVSKIPPDIPFGTYKNTQPAEFFKFSRLPRYKEAFEYMESEDLLFADDEEAFTAVLNDNVALIFDSPFIEFVSSRKGPYNPDCNLDDIGKGLFFPAGYGLGLNKNSPYTDDFSLAILELVEENVIENLITEYFEHRRTCTSDIAMVGISASMDAEQIDLNSVGGLFILLGVGIVLSFAILFLELAVHKISTKRQPWHMSRQWKLPWEDHHQLTENDMQQLIQHDRQQLHKSATSILNESMQNDSIDVLYL